MLSILGQYCEIIANDVAWATLTLLNCNFASSPHYQLEISSAKKKALKKLDAELPGIESNLKDNDPQVQAYISFNSV